VDSLSVEELKHLGPNWMARIRNTPLNLLTGDHLTLYRALEEAFIYHGLEPPPPLISKREEAVVKQEPSLSPSRQGLKLPMPMAPLQSETAEIPVPRPAPIGRRSIPQPPGTEVPSAEKQAPESSDDHGDETPETSAVAKPSGRELRQSDPQPEAPPPPQGTKRTRLEEIISCNQYGIVGIDPFADEFPLLNDEEFEQLCDDIRSNGFLHPIRVTNDGILFDGRCRLQAAMALKLDPPIEWHTPPDIVKCVISENLQRRHLTAAQRALIAEKLARLPRGNPQFRESQNSSTTTMTQKEAAALAGTNPHAISQARLIREWAPEEVDALRAGTQHLEQAYEQAQEKKYKAEGKPPPKPKKQRKQKKDPPPADDVAAAPAALEVTTLEQRANALFSWMQEVREKPSEYDGVSFANLAPESVGKNLEAVEHFYKEFFARLRERFSSDY
jgi:ParB-like chromosome segregation protein Spo0J